MAISRVVIYVLAVLPIFAQDPVTSLEKETALGTRLASGLRQRTSAIEIPSVQGYLDALGQKLAAHMPQADVHFSFTLIAEDTCAAMHEPTALPGGFVFVPAALFLTAQDEAEFAGMLAHAMAHIVQRHGIRQTMRPQLTDGANSPVIFSAAAAGSCGEGGAIPVGFASMQRRHEQEADALAVETMAYAGFDARALFRYIERLQPSSASTLQPREERLASMMSRISQLPLTTHPVIAEEKFVAAREEVRRLVPTQRASPPSLSKPAQ
jgi:predicted Zn-dependent protease